MTPSEPKGDRETLPETVEYEYDGSHYREQQNALSIQKKSYIRSLIDKTQIKCKKLATKVLWYSVFKIYKSMI